MSRDRRSLGSQAFALLEQLMALIVRNAAAGILHFDGYTFLGSADLDRYLPRSVNLMALPSKFSSTCRSKSPSATNCFGASTLNP